MLSEAPGLPQSAQGTLVVTTCKFHIRTISRDAWSKWYRPHVTAEETEVEKMRSLGPGRNRGVQSRAERAHGPRKSAAWGPGLGQRWKGVGVGTGRSLTLATEPVVPRIRAQRKAQKHIHWPLGNHHKRVTQGVRCADDHQELVPGRPPSNASAFLTPSSCWEISPHQSGLDATPTPAIETAVSDSFSEVLTGI